MPKEGKDSKDANKDSRGRKEHELKSLIKSNQEARDSFVSLVKNLGKMKSIEASLINDGIRFGDKVVKITNISTPTLATIIKESGLSLQRGRPIASGSTIWKNNPQAIEAVCSILRKHGLHKGRCYLLDNGITLKNKNGEDEHFAFSHNGKKLLSITTLSDIAKENNISFTQGPRVERVKTLLTDRPKKKKIEKPIKEMVEEILVEEKAVLIEEKIEPKVFKEDEGSYDLSQLSRVPKVHSEVSGDSEDEVSGDSEDEDSEDSEDEDEDFDDDFDEDHEDLDDEEEDDEEEDEDLDDEEEEDFDENA